MKIPKSKVTVDSFVSVIGGSVTDEFLLKDGGTIISETSPGCWGPMITPSIYGGHEVTVPVYVDGAEVGDSIAIFVKKIDILSPFCSSGTEKTIEGNFIGDPSVNAVCPYCNVDHPETYIDEIGDNSVKCCNCKKPIIPQTYENGYTVAYSKEDNIAVAVSPEGARKIAEETLAGNVYLPRNSKQHPATVLGRADFSGLPIRPHPTIGNIGCIPSVEIPSSKNSGDCFASLSKTNLFKVPKTEEITDAHMDINIVGEGSIVISPILVKGAGVYFGDVHLTQGCGEIAGHTLDVAAKVTVKVKIIKNLSLKGPVILPAIKETDDRFKPFSHKEYEKAQSLYKQLSEGFVPIYYPIDIVGTGNNMDEAFQCALQRARDLTKLPMGEIKNRVTVGGEIKIGRTSGCVYLTFLLESSILNDIGILPIVKEHFS